MSKSVAKKNKAFELKNAAQKRVAIAKDVLKQIDAHQYTIQRGTWLNIEDDGRSPEERLREKFESQLEKLTRLSGSLTQKRLTGGKLLSAVVKMPEIKMEPADCTCCAVGAACASAIRLYNQHELEDSEIHSFSHAKEILSEYFEERQLDMIETAFELRRPEYYDCENLMTDANKFGHRYANSEIKRAQAIFQNIIDNKGEFKP